MWTVGTPDIREEMEAMYFHPAITIITPFDSKIIPKKDLTRSLQTASTIIERRLLDNYPEEMSMLMMKKLDKIINDLNYDTSKKSIAIYLTPVFERVLYLDIPVKQKIILDKSFEIREVVYSKVEMNKYLVLLLTGKGMRMYVGDPNIFVKIIDDSGEAPYADINKRREQWNDFYNVAEGKNIMMNKFFWHVDNTLDIILNAYHMPLFIAGTEDILTYFNRRTKHAGAVTEYVCSEYELPALQQLQEIIQPHIADWKKVIEKYLTNQLQEADGEKKLAVGIRNVWREAMNHNGRLLVVEKNFIYAPETGSIDDIIYKAVKPYSDFSCIKDVVGEVIEKVLESGGDVELVDKDVMKDYRHIAMVQYY